MSVPELPRLMLVSDRQRGGPQAVAAAVDGGVQLIQLREKDLSDQAFMDYWRQLQQALPAQARPLWLFNGRPELAARHGCGLHLPATAPGVSLALRNQLPWLGRSAHSAEEVLRALDEGVDYLVIGTLHATDAKPGRAPLELSGLAPLLALTASVPVFAIGGLTPANTRAVRALGAHGVAAVGALLAVASPDTEARRFISALNARAITHNKDTCP